MDINVQELKEKISNGSELVLIDVREPYEHDEFNLGGTLIPLGEVTRIFEEFEDKKTEEVIVYCRSGNRSGMAQQLMKQAGFENVRNLLGGVLAWQENFGS
ncbi:MAG: rhodanese-like domain-containing protein [Saprospiraceae bacterium]|nr:rhodanese-like domain-containing protein [Saprospiraceae bacterium]